MLYPMTQSRVPQPVIDWLAKIYCLTGLLIVL